VFMDRIVTGLGTSGSFADHMVLLVPSSYDLQCALERFIAEMRVTSSKSEPINPNWRRVMDDTRSKAKLQCLGVLFFRDDGMWQEMDTWVRVSSAATRALLQTVVVKE
ncbi:hypothetical protein ILYODFUR_028991, partial [Ilyodon furcidens]